MSFSENLKLKWDLSLLSLIVTNLIVIVLAIVQKWSAPIVLAVYFAQTQIIGFFYFFKIIFKKNTITYGLTINRKTIEPTITNKLGLAIFYYFCFYLVMRILTFFIRFISPSNLDFSKLLFAFLGVAIFFINHLISFLINFKIDSEKEETIKELMITPYLRTIPMFIIVLFGLWLNVLLIGFLILKTIVDIYSHNYMHKLKEDYFKYKIKNKKIEIQKTNLTNTVSPITHFIKGLVIYWIISFSILIVLLFIILGAIVNFWFYIAAGLSLFVVILIISIFIKHFKRINEPNK